jgi:outer membrane protein OmpA-like peptidoglycan-associated protein
VDYLVKDEIPSSRLILHFSGKANLVAPNDTKEGRAQNRRVDPTPQQ